MTNRIIDIARGQDLTHVGTVDQGSYGLSPYIGYNGSTNYSHRVTPGPLKGLAGFTAGGWFRATSNDFLMGVWNPTADFCWKLLTSTLTPTLVISASGADSFSVAGAAVASGTWFHIVGRYTPSTEIALFVNGIKTVNTSSIPSALFDANASFTIGASHDITDLLTGRASMCFFCNEPLEDGHIYVVYGLSRHIYV